MPRWLETLIWDTTEHFDPIGGTARAGYIASLENDHWVVRLFLGETEIVGGARDGAVIPTAFAFDLDGVRRCFDEILRMEWYGFPASSIPDQERDDATIAVDGIVQGRRVRVLINLRCPSDVGPGLKQQPDGTCLPA